jgi:hypothetical protein
VKTNNVPGGAPARAEVADAELALEEVQRRDAEDELVERGLSQRHGIGPVAYGSVAALSYAATLPYDLAATSGIPVSLAAQLVAGLGMAAVTLVAAHVAGDRALDLEEARADRVDDPGRFEHAKREFLFAVSAPIAVIAAVAVWRGETFAAESRAVGGLFPSATAANMAFACLALAAFTAAFFAARSYLRLKPLRAIRARRAASREARDGLQLIIDTDERVVAQAELNVVHVSEHLEHTRAKIDAWRAGRKQQLRHRAGVAEREHVRRLVNKGLRRPDPTASSSPVQRNAATRRGGPPLDLSRLADRVRASVDGGE